MKVTVLTQYFEPEIGAAQLRYAAFVRGLAELGHEVTVLTAMPNHPTGRIFDGYRGKLYSTERTDWGTVHRAWVYAAVGSGPKRYLNFLSFVATSLPMLRFARGTDVLVVESPPVTMGIVALIARRVLGCRLVTYVSDLSTNSIQDLDVPGSGVITRAVRSLESRLYRRSWKVTTVTDGLRRVLHEEFSLPEDRVVMLENGADTETFSPRPVDPALLARFGVADSPYLLYAGTHGYAHGLDVALEAAQLLQDDGIRLVFIGDGSDRERIEALAQEMRLRNVSFHGQQPPEVVTGLYAGAVAGLSTVRDIQVMRDARPAKLFACLSCARPLIYSGSGEGARLATESGGGVVTEPGDPKGIAEAARRLAANPAEADAMGASGRQWVLDNFSWRQLITRWADVVLTN
jgi:glycosyltransferase involved in cell wall biosynthesis